MTLRIDVRIDRERTTKCWVGFIDWLGLMVIWSQDGHSAPKASYLPGREQSCAWSPRRHESGRHAASDRSVPLRGESRSPPTEYKALPHCLSRGRAQGSAPSAEAS